MGCLAVMGDFNEVLNCGDRSSSSATPNSAIDFKHCIYNANLQELSTIGPHYTWTNKNTQGNLVACRLDRCFVNSLWLDKLSGSFAHTDMSYIYDHCSLVLHLVGNAGTGPKPFKLYNAWTTHDSYRQIVADSWEEPLLGSPLFILTQKQRRLKQTLKNFDKQYFSVIS